MPFIPRAHRPKAWEARARAAAAAQGLKAIETAICVINARFGTNEIFNNHKREVERAMQRGAWDVDVRMTYGKIALLCPPNLTGAMAEVERSYRSEVRERKHRAQWGLPTFSTAHEGRLLQARLFLRWYRRFGKRDAFAKIVETMTTPARFRLQAAE